MHLHICLDGEVPCRSKPHVDRPRLFCGYISNSCVLRCWGLQSLIDTKAYPSVTSFLKPGINSVATTYLVSRRKWGSMESITSVLTKIGTSMFRWILWKFRPRFFCIILSVLSYVAMPRMSVCTMDCTIASKEMSFIVTHFSECLAHGVVLESLSIRRMGGRIQWE